MSITSFKEVVLFLTLMDLSGLLVNCELARKNMSLKLQGNPSRNTGTPEQCHSVALFMTVSHLLVLLVDLSPRLSEVAAASPTATHAQEVILVLRVRLGRPEDYHLAFSG